MRDVDYVSAWVQFIFVTVNQLGGLMKFFLIILVVIPLWRICSRAGFHPALSLLAIFPLLGLLIVSGILAFSQWPASKTSASISEG